MITSSTPHPIVNANNVWATQQSWSQEGQNHATVAKDANPRKRKNSILVIPQWKGITNRQDGKTFISTRMTSTKAVMMRRQKNSLLQFYLKTAYM